MFRSIYLASYSIGIISCFYLAELNMTYYAIAILVCSFMLAILLITSRLNIFPHHHFCQFIPSIPVYLLLYLVGIGYAALRTHLALQQQWPPTIEPNSIPLTIQVTGLPEQYGDEYTRFIGKATTAQGQTFTLVFSDYQNRPWQVGEQWQIQAKVRAAIGYRNPVGFDREAWALANQIDGIANIGKQRQAINTSPSILPTHLANQIRQHISQQWQQATPEFANGNGLMRALAIGDRSGLNQATWAAFRPLGLNHLISISGLHVTMFALMAAAICQYLFRYSPYIPKRPRVWYLSIGMLAATLYTALAGWEIPALRSLIMFSIFAIIWIKKGRLGSWQTWWLALTIVLTYQPTATLSIGFWLSFGLVAVLIWALSFRLPETQHNMLTTLKQATFAQGAISLISAMATIFFFGLLPLFSPLVNAIAIPFFTWILVPLAILASIIPSYHLKYFAAWLAEHTVEKLIQLSQWLPEYYFPHPPLALFILSIIAGLILILPQGSRLKPLCCCILASFLLYRPPKSENQLEITIWDVGQGLSVLLQTPSQNILYDTGTSTATELALLPNLRALGINQLHHLILSHHDNDHDGGFNSLKQHIPIQQIWAGQPQFYPQATHCSQGINWQIDNITFEFLTPIATANQHDNEYSCILRVITQDQALLIMGDLSQKGEKNLIKKYNEHLFSQILILGHHGSHSSSSSTFIHTVAPTWAIASSGYANPFKHPHPRVQNTLSAHQVKLLRTDTQGMLRFSIQAGNSLLHPPLSKYWWQKKPFYIVV